MYLYSSSDLSTKERRKIAVCLQTAKRKQGNIKCFSNTCKTHYRYFIYIFPCLCESDFSVSDIHTHTNTHCKLVKRFRRSNGECKHARDKNKQ